MIQYEQRVPSEMSFVPIAKLPHVSDSNTATSVPNDVVDDDEVYHDCITEPFANETAGQPSPPPNLARPHASRRAMAPLENDGPLHDDDPRTSTQHDGFLGEDVGHQDGKTFDYGIPDVRSSRDDPSTVRQVRADGRGQASGPLPGQAEDVAATVRSHQGGREVSIQDLRRRQSWNTEQVRDLRAASPVEQRGTEVDSVRPKIAAVLVTLAAAMFGLPGDASTQRATEAIGSRLESLTSTAHSAAIDTLDASVSSGRGVGAAGFGRGLPQHPLGVGGPYRGGKPMKISGTAKRIYGNSEKLRDALELEYKVYTATWKKEKELQWRAESHFDIFEGCAGEALQLWL